MQSTASARRLVYCLETRPGITAVTRGCVVNMPQLYVKYQGVSHLTPMSLPFQGGYIYTVFTPIETECNNAVIVDAHLCSYRNRNSSHSRANFWKDWLIRKFGITRLSRTMAAKSSPKLRGTCRAGVAGVTVLTQYSCSIPLRCHHIVGSAKPCTESLDIVSYPSYINHCELGRSFSVSKVCIRSWSFIRLEGTALMNGLPFES